MKLNTIFAILSISLLFSSCIVSEDFVLKKNKEIDYKLIIDGSEILGTLGSSMTGAPDASTFSFSSTEKTDTLVRVIDVVRDEVDSESLKGMEEDLKNIEPLYYRVNTDMSAGVFIMELYGTFKNADNFNKAMISLSRLENMKGKSSEESEKVDELKKELIAFFETGKLEWNGKNAKYEIGFVSATPATNELEDDLDTDSDDIDESLEELEQNASNPFAMLTKEVKITTRFHFPKNVKNVDLPEAGIFDGGKTVKIEHHRGLNVVETKEINISTK